MLQLIKEVGMSAEFIAYMAVNLITLGVIYGNMKTQIKYIEKSIGRLEEKQDKHNGLMERMGVVEQSSRASHNRLDKMEQVLDEINNNDG